ncbi:hypothetical protein SAY86_021870 [Trapa natans]|uniref:Clp R domain-containing protein n=1 Tax=Trapa natans TaxID=22666 RepID=A0AAN7MZU9_TRANT|nr:hypothetical protein SAY86_021870 [Trapa natans]
MASSTSFSGISPRVPLPLISRTILLAHSPFHLNSQATTTFSKWLGGFRPLQLKQRNSASWNGRRYEHLGGSSFMVRCEASRERHFYRQVFQQQYTEMAWQGIVSSPYVARENKHPIVETEHLMKALLEQKNGLTRRIFSRAGIDYARLLEATDRFLEQQLKVHSESAGSMLGCDLEGLLGRASEYKKVYGDSFVSVEHLILSFSHDQRFGQRLFKEFQISLQALKSAIEAIRGSQSVVDRVTK